APQSSRKAHGTSMQETIPSLSARVLAGAMLANEYGAPPGDTAARPRAPVPCHVSPPPILGNHLLDPSASQSGWPSSADVLARIDGVLPAYTAYMPSTSR